MFSVFLLGSTDLTIEIAGVATELGLTVDGICHVGDDFRISYARDRVRNYRGVDIDGWCARHGVDAIPFESNAALVERLRNRRPTLGLAAGWYHMVPESVRACFDLGCAGLHASLLPKLRGGAPLNWAILTGERETGVSLFELADGVDDGLLWAQERFPIGPRADVGELIAASHDATRAMLRRCLPAVADGSLRPFAQEGTPTYAMQRIPDDGAIDWTRSAIEIDRLVRAVTRPYPGATCRAGDDVLHIWKTDPSPLVVHGGPGQVLNAPGTSGAGVVTGDGFLLIHDATIGDADALPRLATMNHQRLT